MSKGYLNLTIRAHQPYVRSERDVKFLEQDWFFESLTESYIPLMKLIKKLAKEKLNFKISLVISPTLIEMLKDELLILKYKDYLKMHIRLAKKEVERTTNEQPDFLNLAKNYLSMYEDCLKVANKWNFDLLIEDLLNLEKEGYIKIVPTAATNAFLPLFQEFPQAIGAQFDVSLLQYQTLFNKQPTEFYLPGCGFYSGLDSLLYKHVPTVRSFQVSPFAFAWAEKYVRSGVYSPIRTPSGVYAFARDFGLEALVKSPYSGYPGSAEYREFYRDIGYDLDLPYIKECLYGANQGYTGLKYWAVSDKSNPCKNMYNHDIAALKAVEHANHFVNELKNKYEKVSSFSQFKTDKKEPVFTVTFDAELFGHFWAEGLIWLENLIKIISKDEKIAFIFPNEYIAKYPKAQVVEPALSADTYDGTAEVFLSDRCVQMYHYILHTLSLTTDLATACDKNSSVQSLMCELAVKESLLLMASDWSYMLSGRMCDGFATTNIIEYVSTVQAIYDSLAKGTMQMQLIVNELKKYPLFEGIDFKIFSKNNA